MPGKDRGGGLWSGVDGQEEFGWVQLTLTFFFFTSVDRRSSSSAG